MTPTYKVLICQRATGQVMNTDAKTVYSHPADVEAVIPYHYFDSLAEAEQFALRLHQQDPSLEVTLYVGDDYLKMIPPNEWKGPIVRDPIVQLPKRLGFWGVFKRSK